MPIRSMRLTPSIASSSMTMAADGHPMPVAWTETGRPRNVPVYPSIPRSQFFCSTLSRKVSATYFARRGSPGRRHASA